MSHEVFARATRRLHEAGLIVKTHETPHLHARWVLPRHKAEVRAEVDAECELRAQGNRRRRQQRAAARRADRKAGSWQDQSPIHRWVDAATARPPATNAPRWVFDL